jgi:photosystem II stability/assembly factor-like uncharacterized protein
MKRTSIIAAALSVATALALPATASDAAKPHAVQRHLFPTGASWASAQRGVVLGYPSLNAGAKPSLLETADGGKSWRSLTAPPVKFPVDDSQPNVVAADGIIAVTDGTHIVATRDSGKQWTAERLIGASAPYVPQVAIADGRVLVVVITRKQGALYSGSPESGVLRAVKGISIPGAGAFGDISTVGSMQVDLENGSTTQKYWLFRNGTSFTAAPRPCPAKDVAYLGGVASGEVISLCTTGPSSVAPGTTSARVSIAPKLGRTFRAAGEQIQVANVQIFTAASPSTFVIGTEFGLFRTANVGKTWTFPLPLPRGGAVNDLTFVTATTGFAVTSTVNAKGLVNAVYRTVNAGRKWTAISLP